MTQKIHLYTICWNEEILLPHFLSHYSKFCEKIVVYDNFSDDASEAICKKFPSVQLRRYETKGQIRDEIYLQIKNNCWKESKGKADWVIVCDIDEFLFHPNINDLLTSAQQQGYTLFKSVGYEMVGDKIPAAGENLFDRISYGARRTLYDKTVLFDPNAVEEINYDWGAHTCMPIGVLNENDTDVKLLHYKFLSVDYVLYRYSMLKSRLSKKNRKMNLGVQYLWNLKKIQKQYALLKKDAERIFDQS